MGGTDHPFNLINLTIEEHAEAHRILFEEHGRWQDEIAWKTLSGQISNAEAIKLAQSLGNLNKTISEETRKKMSDSKKGTKLSEETRKKMSIGRKGNPCPANRKKKEQLGKDNFMYGKKWYNNGVKESPFRDDEVPDGWLRGRLTRLFGEKNPFYGKRHSKESINKMKKKLPNVAGENNPFYGKKHSEESKKKMSLTKISNRGKRL